MLYGEDEEDKSNIRIHPTHREIWKSPKIQKDGKKKRKRKKDFILAVEKN